MPTDIKVAIALPALTGDIAQKCLDSIDKSLRRDVILIDNTPDQHFAGVEDCILTNCTGKNVGLPESWNIAINLAKYRGYDYLVFLSASEIFTHGMLDLIEQVEALQPEWGCTTGRIAWHCVVLSMKTLDACGLFDENFWPAYEEDTDYLRRMELLGIHDRHNTDIRMPIYPVAATTQGVALSIKKGGLKVDHAAHIEYYKEKWGGWVGEETFEHPYNDPNNDITYWKGVERYEQA